MKSPGKAPRASLAHDSAPGLVDGLPCSLLGRGLSHQFTGAIGAGWVLVGNQAATSSASVGSLSPLPARQPTGFRDGRDPRHVRNTLDGCRSGGGRRDVSDGPARDSCTAKNIKDTVRPKTRRRPSSVAETANISYFPYNPDRDRLCTMQHERMTDATPGVHCGTGGPSRVSTHAPGARTRRAH